MSDYKKAIALAKIAHGDATDQSGRPVFAHIARVANACDTYGEATVAYLHDIVEDTRVTIEDLTHFFDESIADRVNTLTRRPNERYFDYIARICESEDRVAMFVKLKDLEDHLHVDRINDIPQSLVGRYVKAGRILTEAYKKVCGVT